MHEGLYMKQRLQQVLHVFNVLRGEGGARLQCSIEEARVADVDQTQPSTQGGEGQETLVLEG